jgi:hypothetical protein
MSWMIRKQRGPLLCKQISRIPVQKNGETIFVSFKYPLFKMIIFHTKENKDHTITYSLKDGFTNITYKFPNGETTTFNSLQQLKEHFAARGIIMDMITVIFRRALCLSA